MAQIQLHGTLHVTILEIDNLQGQEEGGHFFSKVGIHMIYVLD